LVVRCGLGGPQLCRAWDGAAAVVDLDRQEMPLCVQPTPAQGVRVVAGVHAPRVYEIPWAAGRVAAKMAEWNAGWWRVICLEAPGTSSVATTHALELTVMAVGVDWFCSLLRSRREWARRWHPRRPSPVRRRLPRPPPTRCSRSAPRASVWQFPKDGMSSLHVSLLALCKPLSRAAFVHWPCLGMRMRRSLPAGPSAQLAHIAEPRRHDCRRYRALECEHSSGGK
jgi:hypothetical protein